MLRSAAQVVQEETRSQTNEPGGVQSDCIEC